MFLTDLGSPSLSGGLVDPCGDPTCQKVKLFINRVCCPSSSSDLPTTLTLTHNENTRYCNDAFNQPNHPRVPILPRHLQHRPSTTATTRTYPRSLRNANQRQRSSPSHRSVPNRSVPNRSIPNSLQPPRPPSHPSANKRHIRKTRAREALRRSPPPTTPSRMAALQPRRREAGTLGWSSPSSAFRYDRPEAYWVARLPHCGTYGWSAFG
jgi:hypothetical protein